MDCTANAEISPTWPPSWHRGSLKSFEVSLDSVCYPFDAPVIPLSAYFTMRLPIAWGIVSLLAVIPSSVLATVLAIDYGAEFITASLMKPGLPFDVLLNKDSKRKISSAVGWKRSDRVFGGDATQLVCTQISHITERRNSQIIRRQDSQRTRSPMSSSYRQHPTTPSLPSTSPKSPPPNSQSRCGKRWTWYGVTERSGAPRSSSRCNSHM
jgi:hypothetical protein